MITQNCLSFIKYNIVYDKYPTTTIKILLNKITLNLTNNQQ
jgi:hypothetical protein